MPEPLMHFNIDIKLQRFDSALKNIVSAGDGYFPDCMNLTKKQVVVEAWADHLTDEKRFEDAATTCLCYYKSVLMKIDQFHLMSRNVIMNHIGLKVQCG